MIVGAKRHFRPRGFSIAGASAPVAPEVPTPLTSVTGTLYNDNDNDVYFTLATSDSRIGKYKTENN